MAEQPKKKRGRPPGPNRKPVPADRPEGLKGNNREKLRTTQGGTALSVNPTGGINTAITMHLKEIMELNQSVDRTDPADLMRHFEAYLNLCVKNDQRPGNLQAYMAMGISKQAANDWKLGRKRSSDPRFMELINIVDMVCGSYRENLAASGEIPPAIAIFWAKNYDGMCDTPAVAVSDTDPLGERKSADDIAAEYADIIEE